MDFFEDLEEEVGSVGVEDWVDCDDDDDDDDDDANNLIFDR